MCLVTYHLESSIPLWFACHLQTGTQAWLQGPIWGSMFCLRWFQQMDKKKWESNYCTNNVMAWPTRLPESQLTIYLLTFAAMTKSEKSRLFFDQCKNLAISISFRCTFCFSLFISILENIYSTMTFMWGLRLYVYTKQLKQLNEIFVVTTLLPLKPVPPV